MKHKSVQLFFLFSLLLPLSMALADAPACEIDIRALDKELNHSLVFIDADARKCIMDLHDLLPNHQWSISCKELCKDMREEGNVASHEFVAQVINECLNVCNNLPHDQRCLMQRHLGNYKERLEAGRTHIKALDDEIVNQHQTRCPKFTQICRLCVGCLLVNGTLRVNGNFFVNGVDFGSIPTLAAALTGAGIATTAGVTAAITAAVSTTGLSAYGFFYALAPPNNPAPLAAGDPITFPNVGTGVVPLGITPDGTSSNFTLTAAGVYEIIWQASTTHAVPEQISVWVNGVELADSVVGGATSTVPWTGNIFITAAAGDAISIRAASGNPAAITLTPAAGGVLPYAATLTIKRIA